MPQDPVVEIGRQYVESDSLPLEGHSYMEQIYSELADIVRELFEQIQVPVTFQKADPYDNYRDMAQTVAQEQQLRIYNQHTDHPHFSHEEQLMFRAVHDWFGHLEADVDFTPSGEYKKWKHMCDYFGNEILNRTMFAEVVGQVCAVHYLPNGFESNRYEQRAFVAPETWLKMMKASFEPVEYGVL